MPSYSVPVPKKFAEFIVKKIKLDGTRHFLDGDRRVGWQVVIRLSNKLLGASIIHSNVSYGVEVMPVRWDSVDAPHEDFVPGSVTLLTYKDSSGNPLRIVMGNAYAHATPKDVLEVLNSVEDKMAKTPTLPPGPKISDYEGQLAVNYIQKNAFLKNPSYYDDYENDYINKTIGGRFFRNG